MERFYLIIFIITLQTTSFLEGAGVIETNFLEFRNLEGRRFDGKCCDQSGWWFTDSDSCSNDCDHSFVICMGNKSESSSMNSCELGRMETGNVGGNRITFNGNLRGMPNPLKFPFKSWPVVYYTFMITFVSSVVALRSMGILAGKGLVKVKIDVIDEDDDDEYDFVDHYEYQYSTRDLRREIDTAPKSLILSGSRTRFDLKLKVFCDAGFYGPDCTIFCKATDDDTGHYNCDPTTGAKICKSGWEGADCLKNIDDCVGHRCYYGSTCVDGVNSYSCLCPPGRTGFTCEAEINECASSPCQNGGRCQDAANSFICQCRPGFVGPLCEIDFDECMSGPCMNGGLCLDGKASVTCMCQTGFTGDFCEFEVNECDSNPCIHADNCTDLIADYDCKCLPGYSGKNCEFNIDDCVNSPCLNDGLCIDGVNSYSCICQYGDTGPNCGLSIDFCDPNYCMNGATCHSLEDKFICECSQGFTGTWCKTDVNECEDDPCSRGRCINTFGGFICECDIGFGGSLCNEEINECLRGGNPCQNSGTCVDLLAEFKCLCAQGFTGSVCEIDINDCEDIVCENDGVCFDMINDFKCECHSNFTGHLCETEISSSPRSTQAEMISTTITSVSNQTPGSSITTEYMTSKQEEHEKILITLEPVLPISEFELFNMTEFSVTPSPADVTLALQIGNASHISESKSETNKSSTKIIPLSIEQTTYSSDSTAENISSAFQTEEHTQITDVHSFETGTTEDTVSIHMSVQTEKNQFYTDMSFGNVAQSNDTFTSISDLENETLSLHLTNKSTYTDVYELTSESSEPDTDTAREGIYDEITSVYNITDTYLSYGASGDIDEDTSVDLGPEDATMSVDFKVMKGQEKLEQDGSGETMLLFSEEQDIYSSGEDSELLQVNQYGQEQELGGDIQDFITTLDEQFVPAVETFTQTIDEIRITKANKTVDDLAIEDKVITTLTNMPSPGTKDILLDLKMVEGSAIPEEDGSGENLIFSSGGQEILSSGEDSELLQIEEPGEVQEVGRDIQDYVASLDDKYVPIIETFTQNAEERRNTTEANKTVDYMASADKIVTTSPDTLTSENRAISVDLKVAEGSALPEQDGSGEKMFFSGDNDIISSGKGSTFFRVKESDQEKVLGRDIQDPVSSLDEEYAPIVETFTRTTDKSKVSKENETTADTVLSKDGIFTTLIEDGSSFSSTDDETVMLNEKRFSPAERDVYSSGDKTTISIVGSSYSSSGVIFAGKSTDTSLSDHNTELSTVTKPISSVAEELISSASMEEEELILFKEDISTSANTPGVTVAPEEVFYTDKNFFSASDEGLSTAKLTFESSGEKNFLFLEDEQVSSGNRLELFVGGFNVEESSGSQADTDFEDRFSSAVDDFSPSVENLNSNTELQNLTDSKTDHALKSEDETYKISTDDGSSSSGDNILTSQSGQIITSVDREYVSSGEQSSLVIDKSSLSLSSINDYVTIEPTVNPTEKFLSYNGLTKASFHPDDIFESSGSYGSALLPDESGKLSFVDAVGTSSTETDLTSVSKESFGIYDWEKAADSESIVTATERAEAITGSAEDKSFLSGDTDFSYSTDKSVILTRTESTTSDALPSSVQHKSIWPSTDVNDGRLANGAKTVLLYDDELSTSGESDFSLSDLLKDDSGSGMTLSSTHDVFITNSHDKAADRPNLQKYRPTKSLDEKKQHSISVITERTITGTTEKERAGKEYAKDELWKKSDGTVLGDSQKPLINYTEYNLISSGMEDDLSLMVERSDSPESHSGGQNIEDFERTTGEYIADRPETSVQFLPSFVTSDNKGRSATRPLEVSTIVSASIITSSKFKTLYSKKDIIRSEKSKYGGGYTASSEEQDISSGEPDSDFIATETNSSKISSRRDENISNSTSLTTTGLKWNDTILNISFADFHTERNMSGSNRILETETYMGYSDEKAPTTLTMYDKSTSLPPTSMTKHTYSKDSPIKHKHTSKPLNPWLVARKHLQKIDLSISRSHFQEAKGTLFPSLQSRAPSHQKQINAIKFPQTLSYIRKYITTASLPPHINESRIFTSEKDSVSEAQIISQIIDSRLPQTSERSSSTQAITDATKYSTISFPPSADGRSTLLTNLSSEKQTSTPLDTNLLEQENSTSKPVSTNSLMYSGPDRKYSVINEVFDSQRVMSKYPSSTLLSKSTDANLGTLDETSESDFVQSSYSETSHVTSPFGTSGTSKTERIGHSTKSSDLVSDISISDAKHANQSVLSPLTSSKTVKDASSHISMVTSPSPLITNLPPLSFSSDFLTTIRKDLLISPMSSTTTAKIHSLSPNFSSRISMVPSPPPLIPKPPPFSFPATLPSIRPEDSVKAMSTVSSITTTTAYSLSSHPTSSIPFSLFSAFQGTNFTLRETSLFATSTPKPSFKHASKSTVCKNKIKWNRWEICLRSVEEDRISTTHEELDLVYKPVLLTNESDSKGSAVFVGYEPIQNTTFITTENVDTVTSISSVNTTSTVKKPITTKELFTRPRTLKISLLTEAATSEVNSWTPASKTRSTFITPSIESIENTSLSLLSSIRPKTIKPADIKQTAASKAADVSTSMTTQTSPTSPNMSKIFLVSTLLSAPVSQSSANVSHLLQSLNVSLTHSSFKPTSRHENTSINVFSQCASNEWQYIIGRLKQCVRRSNESLLTTQLSTKNYSSFDTKRFTSKPLSATKTFGILTNADLSVNTTSLPTITIPVISSTNAQVNSTILSTPKTSKIMFSIQPNISINLLSKANDTFFDPSINISTTNLGLSTSKAWSVKSTPSTNKSTALFTYSALSSEGEHLFFSSNSPHSTRPVRDTAATQTATRSSLNSLNDSFATTTNTSRLFKETTSSPTLTPLTVKKEPFISTSSVLPFSFLTTLKTPLSLFSNYSTAGITELTTKDFNVTKTVHSIKTTTSPDRTSSTSSLPTTTESPSTAALFTQSTIPTSLTDDHSSFLFTSSSKTTDSSERTPATSSLPATTKSPLTAALVTQSTIPPSLTAVSSSILSTSSSKTSDSSVRTSATSSLPTATEPPSTATLVTQSTIPPTLTAVSSSILFTSSSKTTASSERTSTTSSLPTTTESPSTAALVTQSNIPPSLTAVSSSVLSTSSSKTTASSERKSNTSSLPTTTEPPPAVALVTQLTSRPLFISASKFTTTIIPYLSKTSSDSTGQNYRTSLRFAHEGLRLLDNTTHSSIMTTRNITKYLPLMTITLPPDPTNPLIFPSKQATLTTNAITQSVVPISPEPFISSTTRQLSKIRHILDLTSNNTFPHPRKEVSEYIRNRTITKKKAVLTFKMIKVTVIRTAHKVVQTGRRIVLQSYRRVKDIATSVTVTTYNRAKLLLKKALHRVGALWKYCKTGINHFVVRPLLNARVYVKHRFEKAYTRLGQLFERGKEILDSTVDTFKKETTSYFESLANYYSSVYRQYTSEVKDIFDSLKVP